LTEPYFISMKCPYCGGRIIKDAIRGELVCLDCGRVIEDHTIDHGPEWRAFNDEQRKRRERTGSPLSPLKPDQGLSTVIDWRNVDGSGRVLKAEKRPRISRLRKLNRIISISASTEKNYSIAFTEIGRMISQLGLPKSIANEAAILYRHAAKKRLIKGRSIESMVAACIYAACRQYKIPRSLDEISDVARASKREIGRSYRLLMREIIRSIPPSRAMDYIPRLVNDLGLNQETKILATKIIEIASELRLGSGRIPKGLAAAAVYLAAIIIDKRHTQRDIASNAGVTEVTVRNRFKEIIEKLNFEIFV